RPDVLALLPVSRKSCRRPVYGPRTLDRPAPDRGAEWRADLPSARRWRRDLRAETSGGDAIVAVNDYLLPLWMIIFGVLLLRVLTGHRRAGASDDLTQPEIN